MIITLFMSNKGQEFLSFCVGVQKCDSWVGKVPMIRGHCLENGTYSATKCFLVQNVESSSDQI